MNLELTDEQLGLQDTVRRFLAEKASIATHVRPMLGEATGTMAGVWTGLADLGVTGLLVPQEHGGAGATMVEAGIVAEQLGAAVNPGPWLSSAVAAPRALLRVGAEPADLLQAVANGSIATVAALRGPRPHAMNGRTLRGSAEAVPDAAAADVLLVVAEEDHGAALFAVDATADTVVRTPRGHVDPTRKLFDVTFDDTPARRLAGAPRDTVLAILDDVLIASAADAVGAARAVSNLAVDYAKVRRQFDKPIGSFQAVQHLCVDMYETVELARSGVLHALWAADAAGPAERHLAAIRAKGYAARLATVGDTAVQVFGGIGFTWEHDAHLYLKRLLSFAAMAGGTGRYLEEAGRRLVSSVTGRRGTGDAL
ncbi:MULTISPECIES: acyl-CoA dehydrogenase family protein [unclassified Mycobacterium]|uniref:acyl-CoA dehydrogenase family protein n=1 Tax=unclassified Mycobacterium TaxID=2642494 RepID=UPI00073FE66A|nr:MULTISPECIES: acyl-CoA dehydrogenase family protein [unclassified Mycobacterium]KUH88839.1 acyl-CoA dehydrogenase [Mycobacterium sp. GA-0227b]KUH91133.1 acyl-CoA dehydrogenase [Mycobacterium sp. GA-1999]